MLFVTGMESALRNPTHFRIGFCRISLKFQANLGVGMATMAVRFLDGRLFACETQTARRDEIARVDTRHVAP